MKKIISMILLLGGIIVFSPNTATADDPIPCNTVELTCPDGVTHLVMICETQNIIDWVDILCGLGTD